MAAISGDQRGKVAGIRPLYMRSRDLPGDITVRELCKNAETTCGINNCEGAQLLANLWRVYCKSEETRAALLVAGMEVRGQAVTLHDTNPYAQLDRAGREKPTTRLTVGDLPMNMECKDIEVALIKLGCELVSNIFYEYDRDDNGRLTRWKTGKRFMYIIVPERPLPKVLALGIYKAKLYHKEQPKNSARKCFNCQAVGHLANDCPMGLICRACGQEGHKSGSDECQISIMNKLEIPSETAFPPLGASQASQAASQAHAVPPKAVLVQGRDPSPQRDSGSKVPAGNLHPSCPGTPCSGKGTKRGPPSSPESPGSPLVSHDTKRDRVDQGKEENETRAKSCSVESEPPDSITQ